MNGDWLFDHFLWILGGILALLIAFGVFAVIQVRQEERTCKERGGDFVVDHYVPISNGKTVTLVPVYECRMPR